MKGKGIRESEKPAVRRGEEGRFEGRGGAHAPVDSSLFSEVPRREAASTRSTVATPPKETFLKHLLSSESSQSKAMFANPGVHAQVMGVPFRIFSKLTISFSKSTGAP